jgi:hypothetical protein
MNFGEPTVFGEYSVSDETNNGIVGRGMLAVLNLHTLRRLKYTRSAFSVCCSMAAAGENCFINNFTMTHA